VECGDRLQSFAPARSDNELHPGETTVGTRTYVPGMILIVFSFV